MAAVAMLAFAGGIAAVPVGAPRPKTRARRRACVATYGRSSARSAWRPTATSARPPSAPLKRWQSRHGLDGRRDRRAADAGRDGPRRRPVLKRARAPAAAPARAHRRSHRGGGVRSLQRRDRRLGRRRLRPRHRGGREALAAPPRPRGDGIAGPQTRAKLGLGAGPVLKRRGGGSGGGGGGGRVAARDRGRRTASPARRTGTAAGTAPTTTAATTARARSPTRCTAGGCCGRRSTRAAS